MNINLNTLVMFDAAARHLNFRLAAEELFVTQGAVAQRIRKLEEDLNTQLFIREARGVKLTEKGETYYRSVKTALNLIQKANKEMTKDNLNLTISVTPSFASKWLIPRISKLSDEYPEFKVEVIASNDVTNFETDTVDVAIFQGPKPLNKHLKVTTLSPLDVCAVCSPDFKLQTNQLSSLTDLSSYRIIEDSHHFWCSLTDKIQAPSPQQIISVSHTHLAIDAAIDAQGITLTPKILVQSALEKGLLVNLWQLPNEDQQGFHIVYPKNAQSEGMSKIVEWLMNETNL